MSKHGAKPLRGLMGVGRSPLFQGRFGRMFRSLPPARYGRNEAESRANLMKLGTLMTSDFEEPRDATDSEEGGVPALYTYFGQFVDHDITFDPMSSLIKHTDPDSLTDFRTPALDLDNVYGRGPDDQPYMYDDRLFLLGEKIGGGSDPDAVDLPRNRDPKTGEPMRALIGDPRNDENSIVSQLQGLFLRFHNRTVKDHPHIDPHAHFDRIQKIVRFHYQYVVLHDFLPRLVHPDVLKALKNEHGHYDESKLKFFHWKNEPFMPVEFSVAAYRLGHSMIRPGYRMNDKVLLPIFPVSKTMDPADGISEGLTGFRAMAPDRGIDWGRFIDVDVRPYGNDKQPPDKPTQQRLQFAYRIDTSLVAPLSELPPSVAVNPPSLPQRNLLRSLELDLPTGQDVARAMHVTPLEDKEILIGKAVDTPDPGDVRGTIASIDDLKAFRGNCPLWTYILAEAIRHQEKITIPVSEPKQITTPLLGPVGGRIVAEVFLGLMFGDNDSLLRLHPDWHPPSGKNYKLKDFVKYALGQ
jgi:hypothetical protein